MSRLSRIAGCLLLLFAVPGAACAKGAFLPTYHPKPCSGDDCRADDSRSGQPCAGLLCSFSSAKAMQPPITASEAAEMEKARAASAASAAAAAPPEPASPTTPKTRHKRTAQAKAVPAVASPIDDGQAK